VEAAAAATSDGIELTLDVLDDPLIERTEEDQCKDDRHDLSDGSFETETCDDPLLPPRPRPRQKLAPRRADILARSEQLDPFAPADDAQAVVQTAPAPASIGAPRSAAAGASGAGGRSEWLRGGPSSGRRQRTLRRRTARILGAMLAHRNSLRRQGRARGARMPRRC
jgi:hypothetical protein